MHCVFMNVIRAHRQCVQWMNIEDKRKDRSRSSHKRVIPHDEIAREFYGSRSEISVFGSAPVGLPRPMSVSMALFQIRP